MDPNDNDAFYRWILSKIEDAPEEIEAFMLQGNIVNEAMEYFNNDWMDYIQSMSEEDHG